MKLTDRINCLFGNHHYRDFDPKVTIDDGVKVIMRVQSVCCFCRKKITFDLPASRIILAIEDAHEGVKRYEAD